MPSLLWPVAIVLVVAIAYVAPALIDGRLLAPAEGYAFYMPLRQIVAEAFRHGEMPFWNPYSFSGLPLLGALQGGVFFPGTLLFLLLPAVWAFNLNVLGALALAGVGTALFACALGLSRASAVLAGVTFMLGGFMAGHFEHVTMLQAAALVPWLLWGIERFASTGRSRYAIALAGLLAVQIFAGHPQMVAHGLVLGGPYALWRARGLEAERRLGYLASLGLALGLGVGLAALQLLPALDLIAVSQRRAIPYETLVIDGLSFKQLPTLVFPFLYGSAASPWFPTPYWGPGTWMFGFYGYVGLATLMLAGVGAFVRRAGFWLVAAAFALLLALGDSTPLYALWAKLPVFSTMQNPNRHLLEFTLAMAVLAAYGLDKLQRDEGQSRLPLLLSALGVGAVAWGGLGAVAFFGAAFAARTQPLLPAHIDLGAALRFTSPAFWTPALLWALGLGLIVALVRRPSRLWSGALVALVVADLSVFGFHQGWWQLSPRWPQELSYARRFDWTQGRSLTVPAGHYPYFAGVAHVSRLRYPLLSALAGEPTVNGYDAFLVERYARLAGTQTFGYTNALEAHMASGHRAWDLLALNTLRLEPPVSVALSGDRWEHLGEKDGLVVLRNRQALPRAWRVEKARVLGAEAVEAAVTGQAPFDPRREALIEAPLSEPAIAPGTAEAETLSLNRIRVKTSGDGPGLVLISESYDAGWRAFAGTRELEVHQADGLILGVEAPAGAQVIDLRYEPRRWRWGLALSALALLGWLGWGGLAYRRSKRPHATL